MTPPGFHTPPGARVGMIHQPHFLPWPGYVARCMAADLVVMLDNVKFNKGYYHNRTKYIAFDGRETWLTLPVSAKSHSGLLADVEVTSDFRVRPWQRRFHEAYGRLPAYELIWPPVVKLIQRYAPRLVDVNVATLTALLKLLCAAVDRSMPPIALGSQLPESLDRSTRLRDIAVAYELTHLLMGADALQAHDLTPLESAGVTLLTHSHLSSAYHATESDSARTAPPHSGVTVLHGMIRRGVEATAQSLCNEWIVQPFVPYTENI